MNFIMLCGQGGAGKSTFGANLVKMLKTSNNKFIRVDNINNSLPMEQRLEIYINQIQQSLDNNSENIIIDFSHDGILCRKKVLQNLNFSKVITPINFFTISLRPGVNSIIEWDTKRKQVNELGEGWRKRIINCYNSFVYPTENEFMDYPFKTITNLIVDNSNLFQSVNEVIEFLK